MLWIYVLLTTAGIVALVPAVLLALDGKATDLIMGGVGFFGTTAGLTGLFCRQVGASGWITIAAALTIGLASTALHPELLALLRGDAVGAAGRARASKARASKTSRVTSSDER